MRQMLIIGSRNRPNPPLKIIGGRHIKIYTPTYPPFLAIINQIRYEKNMSKKSKHASPKLTAADKSRMQSRFLDLVASGMSARKACEQKGMPSYVSVWNWMKADDEFRGKYQVASELRAQGIDDKIDDTIEEMRSGEIDAQQARVIVDTYKWRAAKLYPKLYGDNQKIDVEHKVSSFVDELKLAAMKIEQRKLESNTIEGKITEE